MTSLNREQITAELDSVIDPVDGQSITAKGMVQGIDIHDETVNVMIAVDPERGPALEDLRQAAEKAKMITGLNAGSIDNGGKSFTITRID